MQISLQNKKALVGGATSGLGKAIAMQLAVCGASVTLMSRSEEKLKNVLTELPANNHQKHSYLVVDFTDYNAFKNNIKNYFADNTIDILVNNTNGPKAGGALDKTTTDYQDAFDLLFKTVHHTTQLALPHMQQQGFGRIINLTSRTVQEPADNLALSNTIRSGITAWAKTLASAVGKHNITVNNILTGNFDTERLQSLFTGQAEQSGKTYEEIKQKAAEEIAVKRIGKPEEMGYLVTFLASEFADYITGTNITIDGGLMKSL